MSEEKCIHYFTFGTGHRHPRTGVSLANCYTTAYGTVDSTRDLIVKIFGYKWVFQYKDAERAGVDRFNLKFVNCLGYEPGELLPPTDAEIMQRKWRLETVNLVPVLDYDGECEPDGSLRETGEINAVCSPYYPTFNELTLYFRKYLIPYNAEIEYDECGSRRLCVNWSHLNA